MLGILKKNIFVCPRLIATLKKNPYFCAINKKPQHYYSMKKNISNRFALPLAVALTMGMGVITACNTNATSSQEQATDSTATTETVAAEMPKEDVKMKAPEIETDANGMITLEQCPTTYEGLRVELSDDITKAFIYLDDQLLQTISDTDEEPLATDGDKSVHFMDANFDGYVDIFIGPGQSRTYSTLLLWDPAAEQFARMGLLGEPALQNIVLHPATKSVFDGGSASWCAIYFSRSIWEGGMLKKVEEVTNVNDPEQYGEYEVNAPYTLKDADGKVIATTDKASELPGVWKTIFQD